MTLFHTASGSGTPLVLLHAFPFSNEMWQPQFGLAGYQLLLPDFPGFGKTDPDPDMTIDSMADAVARLLDELNVAQPVVLGGCSMGGYVALAFARNHGRRLRGLLLSDTKAEPDDDKAKAVRNKVIDAAPTLTAAALMEDMIPKVLGTTTRDSRPLVVEEVRQIGAAQQVAGIVAAQKAMRDRADARPWLKDIRVPTLVVVGEEDAITPPAAAKALADGIRGSTLVTIPAAGHLPNLETPDEFNRVVGEWLART